MGHANAAVKSQQLRNYPLHLVELNPPVVMAKLFASSAVALLLLSVAIAADYRQFQDDGDFDGDAVRSLDSLGGGHILRDLANKNLLGARFHRILYGPHDFLRPNRGLDSLKGATFGTAKRLDSLAGLGFGMANAIWTKSTDPTLDILLNAINWMKSTAAISTVSSRNAIRASSNSPESPLKNYNCYCQKKKEISKNIKKKEIKFNSI